MSKSVLCIYWLCMILNVNRDYEYDVSLSDIVELK
jgi:hypothetical protein